MLRGAKITLRDWREADLETHTHWLQPGHRWKDFDGPYYPGPTLDEIPSIVATQRLKIKAGQLPTPRTSLVISDSTANPMLGVVTWYWESQETHWPLIGIVIYDPANWGQGYGYESLGLWSDYLFREMPQIVRLDLRTWSGNSGMMRLAEKLGFVQEACFRKARIVTGAYYDGLGYGVLREEWQTFYPHGFGATLTS